MKSVSLEYLGGHPDLKGGKKVTLSKSSSGEVEFSGGLLSKVSAEIVDYAWGEQAKRSAGKAAAGAIVGGVLTGGIGAIAGAALGGKRKDNSILHVTVNQQGKTYHLQFRADAKQYNEFVKKII